MSKLRLAADLIVKGVKGYELLTKPKNILEILISNNLEEIKKTVEVAIINSFEIYNIAQKLRGSYLASKINFNISVEQMP